MELVFGMLDLCVHWECLLVLEARGRWFATVVDKTLRIGSGQTELGEDLLAD